MAKRVQKVFHVIEGQETEVGITAITEKTIFSLPYPEFKADKCKQYYNYPCPTLTNPGRTCRGWTWSACTKTKLSELRIYAKVEYPDTAEEVVKKHINNCHLVASGFAAKVIYAAATAPALGTPAAQAAAAIAAVPAAAKAYGDSFWKCLTGISIPGVIKSNIKAKIAWERRTIRDWH